MPAPVYDYPFDTTGISANNLVTNEIQIVTGVNANEFHFIVPRFAPFFRQGFAILNANNMQALVEGTDFIFTHYFKDATLKTALPVYGSIMFLNKSLAGTFILSYQTVGGQWTLDVSTINQILANKLVDPRITYWEQVAAVPEVFPVTPHYHPDTDLTGMAEAVQKLQDIIDAIYNTAPSLAGPFAISQITGLQTALDSKVQDSFTPTTLTNTAPSVRATYAALLNIETIANNALTNVSTLSALTEMLAHKGVANGYTPLGSDGKIPSSFLPDSLLGALTFKGTWNATTNNITSPDPTLNNHTIPVASTANKGWFFITNTSGSTTIDGINSWNVGDWILSIGTAWQKIINTDAVSSVNGHTGIVTLNKSDIGLTNVDNTSDLNKPISTAAQNALDNKQDKIIFSETNPGSLTLAEAGKMWFKASTYELRIWSGVFWWLVSDRVTVGPTPPFVDGVAEPYGMGVLWIKTPDNSLNFFDGIQWTVISSSGGNGSPLNYITGFVISNHATDTAALNIDVGQCADITNQQSFISTNIFSKKINAPWVAGGNPTTPVGGFPSSLTVTGNTNYRVFLIGKLDGTVDYGFDISASASNLLADATGFTFYRRIGWIRTTAGGVIRKFIQDGDHFFYDTQINDIAGPTDNSLVTLSVPPSTTAIMNVRLGISTDGGIYTVFGALLETWKTNAAASATNFDFSVNRTGASENAECSSYCEKLVDTNSQLRVRISDGTLQMNNATKGYIDRRDNLLFGVSSGIGLESISNLFISSPNDYTGPGSYTIPHGLSITPNDINVSIRLKAGHTDLTFVQGRQYAIKGDIDTSSGTDQAISISWDSTNVYIDIETGIILVEPGAATHAYLNTASDWEFICTAKGPVTSNLFNNATTIVMPAGTWTFNTQYNHSHGNTPITALASLRVTTAFDGYSIGDILPIYTQGSLGGTSGGNRALNVWANSTKFGIANYNFPGNGTALFNAFKDGSNWDYNIDMTTHCELTFVLVG